VPVRHRTTRKSRTLRTTGAVIVGAVLAAGVSGGIAHADTHQNTSHSNVAKAASAQAIINLAKAQIGITENSAGGGTKFQQWYASTNQARLTVQRDGGAVADYVNAAWCDMFVSWLGAQTGAKGFGADAYTIEHAKWFQKQGRWGNTPKPGAVVFYSMNGSGGIDGIDHVGLVVQDNGDGTIQSVEGNTSNAVLEQQRPTSMVVGYGYPAYLK
jgi:hypothetical protein